MNNKCQERTVAEVLNVSLNNHLYTPIYKVQHKKTETVPVTLSV